MIMGARRRKLSIQAKIINLKASERRLGLSVIGLSESNYKMLQERGDIVIPDEDEVQEEIKAEAAETTEEAPQAEEQVEAAVEETKEEPAAEETPAAEEAPEASEEADKPEEKEEE